MKIRLPKRSQLNFRAIGVFLFACCLWLIRIPLARAYYERTFQLGYYPPNADSIAIPIASEAITTFMYFPLLVILLLLALWHFPPRCSWLAWNKKRWGWSLFWTALAAVILYLISIYLIENIQIGLYRNAMVNVGWIAVWLELRGVIVSKLFVSQQ